MRRLSYSSARANAGPAQDVTLKRACIGILGLFPMITAVLSPLVGSLPFAAVVAAMGAVTFIALLPKRKPH